MGLKLFLCIKKAKKETWSMVMVYLTPYANNIKEYFTLILLGLKGHHHDGHTWLIYIVH